MKKKNLILTGLAVIGLAVAVSGCGIASTNTMTSGAAQAITHVKPKKGMSEIGFMQEYGNPSRIVRVPNAWNSVALLYCLTKTGTGAYLFGLVNTKHVVANCKIFYFQDGRYVIAPKPITKQCYREGKGCPAGWAVPRLLGAAN